MKGVLKKWLCGLILCCCIICSFSIDVYAGSDVDKLGEAELKRAESLYKYLIANGYSAQAAAGILGNADCETGFSESSARLDAAINAGSYSGYFQMANGVVQKDGSKIKMWEKFRNWCDKNNLDYRDITVQFRYFEETEMKDWSPYCEYPSTTEFKTCNDVVLAAEGFMAGAERCVGGSYALTKARNPSSYGTRKYQGGADRVKWSKQFLEKFAGVTASESDGQLASGGTANSDAQNTVNNDQALTGNLALGGCEYSESELAQYRVLAEIPVELADSSSLTVHEMDTLKDWNANVESNTFQAIFIRFLRMFVSFLGIMFTVWMIFLYLAYWFDRTNVFLEFSLLQLLSFGRLRVSPEDDKCTWQFSELLKSKSTDKTMTINHRAMLTIVVIGCVFGGMIVSGNIFKLISMFITWVLSNFNILR